MRLSVKALAMTSALIWGGGLFALGVGHLFMPSYGTAFLDGVSSIYPGFHEAGSASRIGIGTVYGLVDGGAAGALFAWLYNAFAHLAVHESPAH